jgi:hypothetical protein
MCREGISQLASFNMQTFANRPVAPKRRVVRLLRQLQCVAVVLLVAAAPAHGQSRNDGLWRLPPRAEECFRRDKIPAEALRLCLESSEFQIRDFEYGPDGESVLVLGIDLEPEGQDTNAKSRLYCYPAECDAQVQTLLRFEHEVARLAVSDSRLIAVSRFERREQEPFSVADIYDLDTLQITKTLEFSFAGPQRSLGFSGNGRWIAFGPTVFSTSTWQRGWTRSGSPVSPNRWTLHPQLDQMAIGTPSFVHWQYGSPPRVSIYDLGEMRAVRDHAERVREAVGRIAPYKDAINIIKWRPDGKGLLLANDRAFIEVPIGPVSLIEQEYRFIRATRARLHSITQIEASSDGAWTILAYNGSPRRILLLNARKQLGFYVEGQSFRCHANKPEVLIHQRTCDDESRPIRETLRVIHLSALPDSRSADQRVGNFIGRVVRAYGRPVVRKAVEYGGQYVRFRTATMRQLWNFIRTLPLDN